jgi:flagellar hook-length control protein FliK
MRFRHRPVGKEAARAGRGAGTGPDGNTAAVEAGGSGNAGTAGGTTRAGRGGEFQQQDDGNNEAAPGTANSVLKTGMAEGVHPPVAGEKAAPLPSPFAVSAVDTTPIARGSDTGGGISSAGRTAVITQVIEAAQPLMQRGGGRILISLNPPSLGELEIDVRVKRDSVELFVVANNQDVQQTLCSHVEQLRKALTDQGLNMDRFQVVVGDRSDGQQGRDSRQEGMSGWQWESRSDRGYPPETDGLDASDGIRTAVRSDAYPSAGGINVFI